MIASRISARALMTRRSQPQSLTLRHGQAFRYSSAAPATVVDVGFWKSLIPKPLRRGKRKGLKSKATKEWNPATFFIVMFLFIGSMSIQMIALRNQTERYVRQSSVRLGQLRDALKKMRRGEAVDVEKLLSAAEAPKEADWEEGKCYLEFCDSADSDSIASARARRECTRGTSSNPTSRAARGKSRFTRANNERLRGKGKANRCRQLLLMYKYIQMHLDYIHAIKRACL